MGLPEVKADIQLAQQQLATATTIEELKQQLVDNIFPLLEGLVEATNDGFETRDLVIKSVVEEIDQLVDQDGDVLQPDTTLKITSVIFKGNQLAAELDNLLKKADEVTKKRVAGLLKAYRRDSIVVQELLAEITIPLDEEENEDVAKHEEDANDDDDDDDANVDANEDIEAVDDDGLAGGEG